MKKFLKFGVGALLSLTTACNSQNKNIIKHSENKKIATVYFTRDISPEGLLKIYNKVNKDIDGKVAIKWHSGEPHGPNIIPHNMVKALQQNIPNSNLVETNALYEGGRNTTEKHRETIKINGWNFCEVDIMDEDGNVMVPIDDGKHFKEMSLGKNILNYDSMVVLTHFKGHAMGGYGGSMKNIAIGNADALIGKKMVHEAKDTNDYSQWLSGAGFMENMAESAKATLGIFGKKITFINVLRNMSVDCDCAGVSASPVKARDIGILASTDIVAVDQASIDMVYKLPEAELHDLKERIESREGLHQLPYMEELKMGTRNYKIVYLDEEPSGFEKAKNMIKENKIGCALIKDEKIIATENGNGVNPLLKLYETKTDEMVDTTLVDKVIGRAAAMIAINGKVRNVYGELMSEEAVKLLKSHHIPASYGKLVPKILNKNQDGLCPLEKSIENINDPKEAFKVLKDFINK